MTSPSPTRYTLVVSDFHLGSGARLSDGRPNPMEDFPYDTSFIEFLAFYSTGQWESREVELVINGDFLNQIQEFPQNEVSPHLITEKRAVERSRRIIQGHVALFDALGTFAALPDKNVIFIPGNHDPGLSFTAVQEILRQRIGGAVSFAERSYIKDGVYIEHGDRYEPFHALTPPYTDILHRKGKQPILNIPWATYFFIYVVLPLKRRRTYVDKVLPFRNYLVWAAMNDFWVFLGSMIRVVFFALRSLFIGVGAKKFPVFYMLRMLWDMRATPDLTRGAQRIMYRHPEVTTVVFGHTHLAEFVPMKGRRSYYNTGCWNEITGMSPTRLGTIRRFTYLLIEHTESTHAPSLLLWRGHYRETEEFYGTNLSP